MKNLKNAEIKEGHFYLRDDKYCRWIRLITHIDPKGMAHWEMFDSQDHSYYGGGVCSVDHLCRWALREATAEDMGVLDIGRIYRTIEYHAEDQMARILRTIPDDFLISELVSRGYNPRNIIKE